MLGISTCWWAERSLQGDEIVSDIQELGLGGAELEYRVTYALYQQMRPHLNRQVKVLSIHNFFPKPEERAAEKGSGDLFLLSSTDRDERSEAVKYTIRSIEHAAELESGAVILHLGRVDMSNPIEGFRELYASGKIEQDEGLEFLNEQREIRKNKYQKNLDAVLFSLDKLTHEAEREGIFLGVENRYHFHEIPDFDEIGIILRSFEGGRIGYWHDVGHAAIQEKLGICRQTELLEAYSERMIGIHLHDASGLDDHFAPGQGEINFEAIRPFVKPNLVKILEVHAKAERESLIKGIQFIKKEIGDMTPQVSNDV